ncbi:MAG: nucleoside-triphosphatase [candidate division WOR-3 bacterium]
MKILITGKPRSGKTTMVKKILTEFSYLPWRGFYTEEIVENQTRTGFNIVTTDGQKVLLAHTNITSNYHLGKYKINLEALETVVFKALVPEIKGKRNPIIIDEIGKMELLSEKFRYLVHELFFSSFAGVIVATIPITPLPFLEKLKAQPGTLLINLDLLGFKAAYHKITELIKTCYTPITK